MHCKVGREPSPGAGCLMLKFQPSRAMGNNKDLSLVLASVYSHSARVPLEARRGARILEAGVTADMGARK